MTAEKNGQSHQGQLRPGPVRGELTDAQAERARLLYQALSPMIPDLASSLEDWELGFMRDAHPDCELTEWERILADIVAHKDAVGVRAAYQNAMRRSLSRAPIIAGSNQ